MTARGQASRPTTRAVGPLTALLIAAAIGLVVGFGPLAPVADSPSPTLGPGGDPQATDTSDPASSLASDGTPAPGDTPTGAPRTTADHVLAAHVDHLVSVTDVDGANWGLSVRGTNGQPITDHHGDNVLMPASTLKSLTAAVALETFGAEHRFRTEVHLDGLVTAAGTVVGDLVLVGGGDPVLGSPAFHTWYPARPRTHLEDLADRVVTSGIRRVLGRVVGLDPLLSGPALADGWKDGYLSDFDARRVTGLTIDSGIRLTRQGQVTVVAGEPDDGLVGTLSVAPRLAAARVFEALLEERGVSFELAATAAPAADEAEVTSRPATLPDRTIVLGAVESPPLWRILRFMVQHSDNQLADTIARVVARERTGDPTWAGITSAFRGVLTEMGIDHDGLDVADGSGLSRSDRVSPSVLAEVQAVMASSELAATWADVQAVAGQRGTLRTWLQDTPAVGRFRGKTGTLDDVKGLTGTVWGPDGQALHLAVVVNDAGSVRGNVRLLMDQLVLTLAAALDGCLDLEQVTGLGAWTTGACPAAGPPDELVPQLPRDEPTDAASVAPPPVAGEG